MKLTNRYSKLMFIDNRYTWITHGATFIVITGFYVVFEEFVHKKYKMTIPQKSTMILRLL